MTEEQIKILSDTNVIKELKRIKLTKGELIKNWYVIEHFYRVFYSTQYRESGRIASLQRDPNNNEITTNVNFADNELGRLHKRLQNTDLAFLNISETNKIYKEASILNIKNNVLPWQKQHWPEIVSFLTAVRRGQATKGLYIAGEIGAGKTYLACALSHELAENDKTVIMVKTIELFQYLMSNKDLINSILEKMSSVDILVLDDLGREPSNNRTSWFTLDFLYTIITKRYLNQKPVIITSNYDINTYTNIITSVEKTVNSSTVAVRMRDALINGNAEIKLFNVQNIRSLK